MIPLAFYLLLFLAVGVGFIFVHLVAGKFIRPNKPNPEKGTIYECGEPTIGSAWVQFDLRFYVVALLFVIFDVEVAFFFPWAEVFGKANAIANAPRPVTAEEYVDYAELMQDLATPWPTTAQKVDGVRFEGITGRRIGGKPALDAAGAPMPKLDQARLEEMLAFQEQTRQKQEQFVPLLRENDKLAEKIAGMPANDPDRKELETQFRAIEKKYALTNEESAALQMEGALKRDEFEKTRKEAAALARLALVEVLVFFGVLLVGFAYLWRRGDIEWVRSTAAERLESRGQTPPEPPTSPPSPAPAPVRETVGVSGH